MGKQRTAKMRMKTCAYNKRKINPRNMHVTNNNQIVDRLRLCDTYTHVQYILYIQTGNDIAQSIFFLQLLLCERSRMCDRAFCIFLLFSKWKTHEIKIKKNYRETTERSHIAYTYWMEWILMREVNFGKFNRYSSEQPSNLYTFMHETSAIYRMG